MPEIYLHELERTKVPMVETLSLDRHSRRSQAEKPSCSPEWIARPYGPRAIPSIETLDVSVSSNWLGAIN